MSGFERHKTREYLKQIREESKKWGVLGEDQRRGRGCGGENCGISGPD